MTSDSKMGSLHLKVKKIFSLKPKPQSSHDEQCNTPTENSRSSSPSTIRGNSRTPTPDSIQRSQISRPPTESSATSVSTSSSKESKHATSDSENKRIQPQPQPPQPPKRNDSWLTADIHGDIAFQNATIDAMIAGALVKRKRMDPEIAKKCAAPIREAIRKNHGDDEYIVQVSFQHRG